MIKRYAREHIEITKYDEEPDTAVTIEAIVPPVQLSALDKVYPYSVIN